MLVTLDADVAVIGLGAMGSMALWRSAHRGLTTLGFERFNIGHDRSASGAETRQFRAHLLEPFVLEAMAESQRLYRELEAQTDSALLHITGGLTFGARNSPIIQETLARARAEDYPLTEFSAQEARLRWPQHTIGDDDIALWDAGSGFIRPEFSVVSAVRAATSAGATVHSNTAVEHIEQRDGYLALQASGQEYRVGKVIVAAGPWSHQLADLGDANVHIRRMIMTWFPAIRPQSFTPDVFPTWSIQLPDGAPAFGVPSVDGGSVKVAIVETYGDFLDPATLDYGVRPSELERVSALVERRFPELIPSPIRQSVHMDLYTGDEQPIVDHLAAMPDVFLASGFSGRGFKLAPAIGEIAAGAAAGEPFEPIREWSAARFGV